MQERSAQGDGRTANDLSDTLTAALAAAAGRAGDSNRDAYLRALSLAQSARTEEELRAAIAAARAVGS